MTHAIAQTSTTELAKDSTEIVKPIDHQERHKLALNTDKAVSHVSDSGVINLAPTLITRRSARIGSTIGGVAMGGVGVLSTSVIPETALSYGGGIITCLLLASIGALVGAAVGWFVGDFTSSDYSQASEDRTRRFRNIGAATGFLPALLALLASMDWSTEYNSPSTIWFGSVGTVALGVGIGAVGTAVVRHRRVLCRHREALAAATPLGYSAVERIKELDKLQARAQKAKADLGDDTTEMAATHRKIRKSVLDTLVQIRKNAVLAEESIRWETPVQAREFYDLVARDEETLTQIFSDARSNATTLEAVLAARVAEADRILRHQRQLEHRRKVEIRQAELIAQAELARHSGDELRKVNDSLGDIVSATSKSWTELKELMDRSESEK